MMNKRKLSEIISLMRGQPNFRTLPSSGRISASDINTELGRPATSKLSIDDVDARLLAGRPSGRIAYSDFHGKQLLTAPRFTIHPESQSVNDGDNVTFTATAVDSGTGSGNITYDWYVDGTLTLSNQQSFSLIAYIRHNGEKIQCKASNRKGAVLSNEAVLTIAIPYNIEMTIGASGANIKVGYDPVFGSVTTNGLNGLRLQHPQFGELSASELYGMHSYPGGYYDQVYMLIIDNRNIPLLRWRIRSDDGLDTVITSNSLHSQAQQNNDLAFREWARPRIGQTRKLLIEPA